MSKPINPKYLGENGIHRVPLWRIGGFALNNTATNLYMFLMNYLSFYLMGFVGVGMMMASSFVKITTLAQSSYDYHRLLCVGDGIDIQHDFCRLRSVEKEIIHRPVRISHGPFDSKKTLIYVY